MAPCFEREHAAIFVVGMGDYLHQPRRRSQPQQFKAQTGQSLILRYHRRNALVQQSWQIGGKSGGNMLGGRCLRYRRGLAGG